MVNMEEKGKDENIGTEEKVTHVERGKQKETREIKKEDNFSKEEKKDANKKTEVKEGNEGQTIKDIDLETLEGKRWLNDEVINRYLELIVKKNKKTYAFGTFFFSRLLSGGFTAVQRWTRKFNIFNFDLVVIPLHLGAHWCLVTIDLKNTTINYFDSLMGDNPEYPTIILEYLIREAASKKQTSFNLNQWSIKIKKDIPRQSNNYDCGVFVCCFAEYEAAGRKIDFCQADMAAKRQQIKNCLKNGKIE
ncbi:sentrin-specific protease 1-like [Venturia canescens]|uniref:sentrin-specific protease 1-like n=1 Tax=Venturia canescens TaxID=32260 RepID=UPI001C9D49BB|nr:sentrin-specific protease 1-like [Venturia canescens]